MPWGRKPAPHLEYWTGPVDRSAGFKTEFPHLDYSAQLSDFLEGSTLAEKVQRRIAGTAKKYSYGGKADLDDHFEMLRDEFVGRTELELYHAMLMVFIRRKVDLEQNVSRAQSLWSEYATFLCANLDSRWLVSACDTIMDHWSSERERALAAAACLLTNTIKLYETERWATDRAGTAGENYRALSGRVALHDGLSAFTIGNGDMISNMHRRIRVACAGGGAAGMILEELLRRASMHDTVYKRFRDVHINDATRW